MDVRSYDPAIGRFTGIDPVVHHSMSTYTAFDNNPVFWADPSGANSTAEWMKENGITLDDLITIYQAPDNSNESADSHEQEDKDPKVYFYGKSANDKSLKKAKLADISDDKELIGSILGLFPNHGSDPNEVRNALISSVTAILTSLLPAKANAASSVYGGLSLDILPPTMVMAQMKNDFNAMDRLVDYENSTNNPYSSAEYVDQNNLLLIFSEVNLFKNKKYNSTNNTNSVKYPDDLIEKMGEKYSKIKYIYMGVNLGGGNISIINKRKL